MPDPTFAYRLRAAGARLALLTPLLALAAAALACNVQFGGPVRTPIGTLTAAVVMLAPTNNSRIAEGATVEIAATARDDITGVARIEFFLNGISIGSQNAPIAEGQTEFTARITWKAQGIQGHFLTAEASRADGSRIGEAGTTFEVVPAPSVMIAAQPTATSTLLPTAIPTSISTVEPTAGVTTAAPPALSPTSLLILPPGPALVSATPSLPGLVSSPPVVASPTPLVVVAPSATPEPPIPQPPAPSPAERPTLRVIYPFLNVRAGPGTSFEKIAELKNGDAATIVGRNADRTWWAVEKDDLRGWVINDRTFIEIVGDTLNVPLATSSERPMPSATPPPPALAPTSTTGPIPDLVIDSVSIEGQPRVGVTFFVLIVVRNTGTVDSGSSLLVGVFQPGNERSEVALGSLPGGAVAQIRMPVTLRAGGPNQTGTLILDAKDEVAEGPNGEANNVRTITYNVQ